MYKAADFLYSPKQLRNVASNIIGKPVTETHTGLSLVLSSSFKHRIDIHFVYVHLPDGMDEDKDNQRQWLLILSAQDLGRDETASPPLDLTNEAIAKGFSWMVDLGHSEHEVKAHWSTLVGDQL